jgi:hypothetical protein
MRFPYASAGTHANPELFRERMRAYAELMIIADHTGNNRYLADVLALTETECRRRDSASDTQDAGSPVLWKTSAPPEPK